MSICLLASLSIYPSETEPKDLQEKKPTPITTIHEIKATTAQEHNRKKSKKCLTNTCCCCGAMVCLLGALFGSSASNCF